MSTSSARRRQLTRAPVWTSLLLLAVVAASCEQGQRKPKGEVTTVVLVTIDTWRRDATGFLGGLDPSPTPFLDGLARSGYVAQDAVAPVPQTGPSHWSMMSGRWPWRDGFRTNGDTPSPDHPAVLAQVLRREGWRTAGFVSCIVLDHRFGFAAGFEHFDDQVRARDQGRDPVNGQRRGDETVAAALAWLQARDGDEHSFVWVHLFDPHFPYEPLTGARAGEHGDYLGEVAFADAQVRVLHEGLDALGRTADRTLWVVLSDHGEGLGEHSEMAHSFLLHGATTRIPFLISGPAVPARRDEAMVSTVDVLPTLLPLLGYEASETDGLNLLEPRAHASRSIPMETFAGLREFGLSPVFGLRTQTWLWEGSNVDRLWNLTEDPDELSNLAQAQPDRVAQLRRARQDAGMPPIEARSAPRPELDGQLRALGYAGGNLTEGRGDPREYVVSGEAWRSEMMTLVQAREYEQAEEIAKKFLARYPNSPSTWVEAGFISLGLNAVDEAERRFRMATGLDCTSTQAQVNLANVLFMKNDHAGAELEYRGVLEKDPGDLFALRNLGQLQAGLGHYGEAAELLSRFLELYPEHEQAASVEALLRQWKQDGRY